MKKSKQIKFFKYNNTFKKSNRREYKINLVFKKQSYLKLTAYSKLNKTQQGLNDYVVKVLDLAFKKILLDIKLDF